MSWFLYRDSQPKYRKGICLRTKYLREDKEIGPILRKYEDRFGLIKRCEAASIEQRDKNGIVYIHLHFYNNIKNISVNKALRKAIDKGKKTYVCSVSKIVRIRTIENPEWVCEGDVGRGLVK